MESLRDQILFMLRPLQTKVRRLTRRATIEDSDDSGMYPRLKLWFGKGLDFCLSKIPNFTQFGFHSRPMDGAEVIVVQPNGDEHAHAVVVAYDHRYRPKNLAKGESVFYNAFGASVVLKADGSIHAGTGAAKVTITPDGKLALGNATLELVDAINQILEALILLNATDPTTLSARTTALATTATALQTLINTSLKGSL